jgi:DNA-binding MarR family transcriptional regulator
VRYEALERELVLLMRRGPSLARELAEEIHPELDVAGYSTLSRISDLAPVRAADLVAFFGIDKAAVSRQIRRLEELGLVERASNPRDGRSLAVRLTPLGDTRLRQVGQARNARFRSLLDSWPQADVDELARLLGRLNQLFWRAGG